MSAKFTTTNPATGHVLEEFPTASDEEISAVIDASDAAFQTWRTTDIRDRTEPIARAADLMD
ncbi:MAG TPA: aldehyde dehydrogenase family protein, partial [Candidatus Brevibacterium intestinavium]|nr:aldehyde dehydrogenase family protein [Candidatus Brevibacterium intestinavium]